MNETPSCSRIILDTSLQTFFHDSVHDALSRQQVQAQPETASYLINLMVSFLHTHRLFDAGDEGIEFKPLALRYGDALQSAGAEQRARSLRELGDVALFVAGVFAESFSRKLVDVDYYASMGGVAYSQAADTLRSSSGGRAYVGIFEELADKFIDFADVIGEAAESPEMRQQQEVLRLYERWLKTGSRRAAEQLRALGIEPNTSVSRTSH